MTNNYPLYPRTWINGDRTEQQLVELWLTTSAFPRMGVWQKSTERLSHYTRVSPQSTALPKTSLSLATFDAKSHQITIKNCKKCPIPHSPPQWCILHYFSDVMTSAHFGTPKILSFLFLLHTSILANYFHLRIYQCTVSKVFSLFLTIAHMLEERMLRKAYYKVIDLTK